MRRVRLVAKRSGRYEYPRLDIPAEIASRLGLKPGDELLVGGYGRVLVAVRDEVDALELIAALLDALGYKPVRRGDVIRACKDGECVVVARLP